MNQLDQEAVDATSINAFNNNLRLLQLQSNRAVIQYQHSPRRAENNSRHAGQHYIQKG